MPRLYLSRFNSITIGVSRVSFDTIYMNKREAKSKTKTKRMNVAANFRFVGALRSSRFPKPVTTRRGFLSLVNESGSNMGRMFSE